MKRRFKALGASCEMIALCGFAFLNQLKVQPERFPYRLLPFYLTRQRSRRFPRVLTNYYVSAAVVPGAMT